MPNIQTDKPKQSRVFVVSGSLNQDQDITVNTIAPIANPNRRDGHNCPSKCTTKYFTDCMYSNDSGMPIKDM